MIDKSAHDSFVVRVRDFMLHGLLGQNALLLQADHSGKGRAIRPPDQLDKGDERYCAPFLLAVSPHGNV